MNRKDFENLVAEAIDELPEEFAEKLDNVAIVVEEEATPALKASLGLAAEDPLLGLYHGIPLTKRGSGYSMITPDKIVIYQRPFDRRFRTNRRKKDEVRRTVMHEIAHHFGMSDHQLYAIEDEKAQS